MLPGIKIVQLLLLIFAFVLCASAAALPRINYAGVDGQLLELRRVRRQFDITLSAEHDDKEDETELALEAIANLWRSADMKTQVDGSAKVVHRTTTLQAGNTRFSGRLHVHHDYKRK